MRPQKPSLFLLVNFIVMVLAVPHGKFNASRTVMGYETSTLTSLPWRTASPLASQVDDATKRTTLNSTFSSNANVSSTIFKLSNASSLASNSVMIGDNVDKKAQVREENAHIRIISEGYVEVIISELFICVSLKDCYNDLQICYEAVDSSSELPRTICGVPGQCGLRFGTSRVNPKNVWFMHEPNIAMRTDIGECKFAKIQSGYIELAYSHDKLNAEDAGCDPNILSDGYMKISVNGASEDCSVLIANAELKPESTTAAPTSVADGTQEASNSELYIWLAVGGLILFIIIVVVIIGVLCWKKRQYKTKQQLPPAKPMKAIMDKPIEDSGPSESIVIPLVEAKPVVKEEKVSVPVDRNVDVEKAEPAPMKPQVTVETKKPKPVEPVEKVKLVKEAREMVKRRTHVVNETQKDEPRPRRAPSKKKTTKVAAPSPSAIKEEEEPSKEAATLSPLPHIAIKVDHQKNDQVEKSVAYYSSGFSSRIGKSKKYNPILEEGSDE